MKFICESQTTYRYVDAPLEIDLHFMLVDVHPNDIEKMAETLAEIEKVLAGSFTITPVKQDE